MEPKVYGYIRVSTREQNESRQMIAMEGFPMPQQNIWMDKQSGKDFERPAYKRMVRKLRRGDLLVVKSIDRLGRNYKEIIEQWRVLTKEKGVDIAVMDMPLLDTRRGRDLMGTFIADVVLQLLSFVAENERDNIRQRQAEGIAAARLRGVRFGRPPLPVPPEFGVWCARVEAGEASIRTAARAMGVSHETFRRWFKRRAYAPAQADADRTAV